MRKLFSSTAAIALGTLVSVSCSAGGIDKAAHHKHGHHGAQGKWYVRADLGRTDWKNQAGFINNQVSTGNTDMRPYWLVEDKMQFGVGVGRCLPFHLRTDLMVQRTGMSHMHSYNVRVGTSTTYGDLYTGAQSTTGMVDLYWDLGDYSHLLRSVGLNPYVGAGAGLAQNKMGGTIEKSVGTSNVVAHIPGHKSWSTAAQAGFGLTYALGKSPFKLDAGYMYLDAGKAKSAAQMDVNSSSEEQLIQPSYVKLSGGRWNVGVHYHF